ncbi:hypothetical protein ACOZ4B_20380 (plasmid) [Haloferax prahovense]|uniref:hypothetical protein n=1 Tax=Haloferax prahovense TaxID=381852 RepID=UPI003C7337C1
MTRRNDPPSDVLDGISDTTTLDWLDRDDPYAAVDLDALPEWWRIAVEEFRDHHLGPYRPPRFADGLVVPPVLDRLEAEYDVDIQFIGIDVAHGDTWGIYADGDRIGTVSRERTRDGYTRYDITSGALLDTLHAQLIDTTDDATSTARTPRDATPSEDSRS